MYYIFIVFTYTFSLFACGGDLHVYRVDYTVRMIFKYCTVQLLTSLSKTRPIYGYEQYRLY